MFESGDIHRHTDGQTTARVQTYKLTLRAFGSGELKTAIQTKQSWSEQCAALGTETNFTHQSIDRKLYTILVR